MKRKISQIFDTANSESVIQPVDLASQLLSVFIDGIQEVSAFEIKSLFESIASGEPFETIIAKYDYSFSDNPPNALNSYGFNLLLWAVLHERKDIVEALIEREFDVNAVHRLSISEDLTQTKYLSDAAFEHLQEIKQCTECETYRECMDGFEDPELFIINQYVEHTALTLASHLHSFEILSLLLSNGADRYQEVNQRSFGIDIEFDHSIMQQSPDFTVGLNALHFASLAHKETTNAHRVDCTIEALFDGLTDEQIIEYIKTPGADFRALELNTRTFWRLRFGGALEFSAQKNHRIFATLLSFGVTLRDNLVLEVCYEPDQSMPSNMKYTFLEYLMRLDDPAGCLYILKNFFDTSDLLEYVSDPHHRLFGSIAQWGEFFYEEDTAMSCDHLSDVFQEFRSLGISSRHPFSPFHAEDETLEHFFRELIVRKEEYLSHTISIFNPEDVVEDWCYIRLAFSDHSNIHSAVLEHYIKNSYNDYEPEYIRSKILEFRTLIDQCLNGVIDQDAFRSHFHS
ncbi:MAG: hypothetical protein CMF41_02525, partial [Legionellales bacterium]|nr:hypothetical protein [Legionellales bacterium]